MSPVRWHAADARLAGGLARDVTFEVVAALPARAVEPLWEDA
ncbi:hypothetical protein [Microtetraspora sp. NBRC 16547]|nr:hypothetical protein [Microtetraspora sp. NBRC 16547]